MQEELIKLEQGLSELKLSAETAVKERTEEAKKEFARLSSEAKLLADRVK